MLITGDCNHARFWCYLALQSFLVCWLLLLLLEVLLPCPTTSLLAAPLPVVLMKHQSVHRQAGVPPQEAIHLRLQQQQVQQLRQATTPSLALPGQTTSRPDIESFGELVRGKAGLGQNVGHHLLGLRSGNFASHSHKCCIDGWQSLERSKGPAAGAAAVALVAAVAAGGGQTGWGRRLMVEGGDAVARPGQGTTAAAAAAAVPDALDQADIWSDGSSSSSSMGSSSTDSVPTARSSHLAPQLHHNLIRYQQQPQEAVDPPGLLPSVPGSASVLPAAVPVQPPSHGGCVQGRHAGHGVVVVLLLLVGLWSWLYLGHLLLLHSFLALTNQTTLEVLKVRGGGGRRGTGRTGLFIKVLWGCSGGAYRMIITRQWYVQVILRGTCPCSHHSFHQSSWQGCCRCYITFHSMP